MTKEKSKLSLVLRNKKIVFLFIVLVFIPLLLITFYFSSNFSDSRYKPLENTESKTYVKSSLKKINKNFEIESFYIEKFYLEENDQTLKSGKIEFEINLGKKLNANISSSSIAIKVHAGYNWYEMDKTASKTVNLNDTEQTIYMSNIDSTILNEKPNWYTKVKVEDILFYVNFSWTESDEEVNQYVVFDYKDLVNDNTSFLK